MLHGVNLINNKGASIYFYENIVVCIKYIWYVHFPNDHRPGIAFNPANGTRASMTHRGKEFHCVVAGENSSADRIHRDTG